jgi:hypothetical protein
MANLTRFTGPLFDLDSFHIFDDFWMDQTDLTFVDTITDTGTVAIGDAVSGIATLTPSDGTVADNDEVYFATANMLFKFLADRPLYGRFRFALVPTTISVMNAAVGFQNAVGANSLVDDGGGVKVSGSTLAVEKRDGETAWRATSACNGVATTTLSTKTVTSGATTWHDVEIECGDWDGVSMKVSYKVDGEYLRDTVNNLPIRHTVAIASATEMSAWAGVKLGAITNNDTMLLDFVYAAQRRAGPTT